MPLGGYFSILACFWLLLGAIELIKHFINRARVEILRDLRMGVFDVIVGINLLREGLDLPEVTLVAVLDADD